LRSESSSGENCAITHSRHSQAVRSIGTIDVQLYRADGSRIQPHRGWREYALARALSRPTDESVCFMTGRSRYCWLAVQLPRETEIIHGTSVTAGICSAGARLGAHAV